MCRVEGAPPKARPRSSTCGGASGLGDGETTAKGEGEPINDGSTVLQEACRQAMAATAAGIARASSKQLSRVIIIIMTLTASFCLRRRSLFRASKDGRERPARRLSSSPSQIRVLGARHFSLVPSAMETRCHSKFCLHDVFRRRSPFGESRPTHTDGLLLGDDHDNECAGQVVGGVVFVTPVGGGVSSGATAKQSSSLFRPILLTALSSFLTALFSSPPYPLHRPVLLLNPSLSWWVAIRTGRAEKGSRVSQDSASHPPTPSASPRARSPLNRGVVVCRANNRPRSPPIHLTQTHTDATQRLLYRIVPRGSAEFCCIRPATTTLDLGRLNGHTF